MAPAGLGETGDNKKAAGMTGRLCGNWVCWLD